MTPQEHLKEIEHENMMSGGDRDITFLISRVRVLEAKLAIATGALERLTGHNGDVFDIAREALREIEKV